MGERATATFRVTGMHCASCGLLIDETVEEIDGIERCETDSRRGRTVVRFDSGAASLPAIAAAIEELGYGVEAEA